MKLKEFWQEIDKEIIESKVSHEFRTSFESRLDKAAAQLVKERKWTIEQARHYKKGIMQRYNAISVTKGKVKRQ